MTLAHLRSFVEVYRQGSVGRAAQELGLTQPAVSGHISSLEAQLERKLFTRHSRGVKPTMIADELAQRVSAAIDTAENALAEARARSLTLTGTIHLCGPFDILSDLLVDRLRSLTDSGLSLKLRSANGPDMMDMLVEGRSDFAFAVIVPSNPRIDSAPFGEDEVLLAASPSTADNIARFENLNEGLMATPYLSYDADHYLLQTWLDHNQMTLGGVQDIVTTPDLRALRNFVEKGFGWSILPRYLVQGAIKAGDLVEISGPQGNPVIAYHLLWLRSSMRNPRSAKSKALLLEAGSARARKPA